MKKILLGFCLILLSLPTLAKTVSGTVIDSETGETVPYASIVYYEGNTPYGGETDSKGNFSLTVPDNTPITVTLIGYEDKTISNPTENMTIDLDLDTEILNEVVITAPRTPDIAASVQESIDEEIIANQQELDNQLYNSLEQDINNFQVDNTLPEIQTIDPNKEAEIAELQAKADEAKADEQSIANTLLGGAGIGATSIGGMMATSALAEQSADAAAELDMSGYIATFRCTYGSYQAKGGDANITLPGANILLPLYTEYQQLAADLKQRKEALNMSPGIESEVVMDKATSGLYDDTSIGITNGTYASVYRALTNTSGEDAAQLSEQAEKTKSNLTAGAITAGVGAGGSIVGNLIINNPKDAQNTTEQENTNAVNQQM